MNDKGTHESLHSDEKKFVCKGDLAQGQWGCGRRFAQAKNLGRHFRSEKGRICIKPLLDEERLKRDVEWKERQAPASMLLPIPGANRQSRPELIDPGNVPIPAAFPGRQFESTPKAIETGRLVYGEATLGVTDPDKRRGDGGPHAVMMAPPTRDEALKAADTIRRYIQLHGLLTTSEKGGYGCLELTFKPFVTIARSSGAEASQSSFFG